MSRRWLAAALVAVWLCVPVTAGASGGWNWPVDGDTVLLYGASYVGASGKSCTHGGLDIGAPAGSEVRSAVQGEVVFSGLVPAGEGERAWAVTVLTGDGLRVTYLPLTSARVRRGETVRPAQELGTLAGSGDASGGGSHLHFGVKRGDTPLDPLTFLGSRSAAPPAASSSAAGASTGAGSHTTVPARPHAAAQVPAPGVTVSASGYAPSARTVPAVATPEAAVHAALRELGRAPGLARIEQVAAPPVLNLARARAEWDAARDSALSVAARVALGLLACACVWPVLGVARAAGAQAVPELARHEDR